MILDGHVVRHFDCPGGQPLSPDSQWPEMDVQVDSEGTIHLICRCSTKIFIDEVPE